MIYGIFVLFRFLPPEAFSTTKITALNHIKNINMGVISGSDTPNYIQQRILNLSKIYYGFTT